VSEKILGYCSKCKTKQEILTPEAVFTKKGRPAIRGICAVCETKIFSFGKTSLHHPEANPAKLVATSSKARKKASTEKKSQDIPSADQHGTDLVGYCSKCKQKQEIHNAKAVFTKAARPALSGTCSVCEARIFSFGKTSLHEGLTQPKRPPNKKAGNNKKGKAARKLSKLVIVESPTKAKTIGKYLGAGYNVIASQGHVRDLLKSRLSVDIENEFEPTYRVLNEKKEVVKEITDAVKTSKEIWLATDPDREGEAIAWHLMETANMPPEQVKRVVFHEITKKAILKSFEQPRPIDMKLVDAQQTRRILDRLVGFNLSPLLWKKVRSRLSAGRVQSVALRMVVEREREVREFIPVEYWSIRVQVEPPHLPGRSAKKRRPPIEARLHKIDGENIVLPNATITQQHVDALVNASYVITKIRKTKRRRRPSAPFTTSTLQQEASRRLSFGTQRTMSLAQALYEGIDLGNGEQVGLITYMRTDSVTVSKEAIEEARTLIREQYGAEFVPEEIPTYKTRAKKAQEAHEAIRPTSALRTPKEVKPYLDRAQWRLYNLIWSRFIASQMEAAIFDQTAVDIVPDTDGYVDRTKKITQVDEAIVAKLNDKPRYLFRTSGSVMRFAGFMIVYQESKEERESKSDKKLLPQLHVGEVLDLREWLPSQHFTQSAPRYSDATLVKALEENGIGRPSTYAPIVNTLTSRGYCERDKKRLVPTELGEIVTTLLVEHFPEVLNAGFTARMEDELDGVAAGEREWVGVLDEFYGPFNERLEAALTNMEKVELEEELAGINCDKCGREMVVRFGRYGKFLACPGFPDCRSTKPYLKLVGVGCPQCEGDVVEKRTKRGRIFYGCSTYPECEFSSWKKPILTRCPSCEGLLVEENKSQYRCIACEERFLRKEIDKSTQKS